MKVPFTTILQRISGFSTPIFGISWNPPQNERDIVQALITYLEDKRVLYVPTARINWLNGPNLTGYTVQSVLEIRQRLTRDLETLDRNSELFGILSIMRSACRDFLEDQPLGDIFRRNAPEWSQFVSTIRTLRIVFGEQIAALCLGYGVDISPELASILPYEDVDKIEDAHF